MKKLNPCTWIRQARYPKTDKGRKAYLQDSLSKDDLFRTYQRKELRSVILIIITCLGLLVLLALLLTSA